MTNNHSQIIRRITRRSNIRRVFQRLIKIFKTHLLLSLTISSVFVGLIIGFAFRGMNLSQESVRLINFPGEIFMQVLKLMILPLIFSSLVSALAQMDAKESGQMSLFTVGYYVITTLFATMTGILLVLVIHPGDPAIKQELAYLEIQHNPISPLDTFLDVIRNMFPENVIQATMQRTQTKYYFPLNRKTGNKKQDNSSQGGNDFNLIYRKKIENINGMNILGIIVFCTGFGIVISQLGERAKIIVEFFIILEAVIMQLVGIFMWLTPLGIVSLISGNLLELTNLSDTAAILLLYVFTVLSSLFIHTFLTMPLIYFLFTRKNPLKVAKGMLQALVTAFGTASGGAALPVSMRCMEENLKIDSRITRFVLPLGSTINMDGNALYEAVAVIFIAQLNNVTLTLTEVITVSFIATIASLGLNSVPAGLVSIFVILSTVGLPVKDIPLVITADWLLDRIRTSINVLGDAFVASTVSHYLEFKLKETDNKLIKNEEEKEGREFNNDLKIKQLNNPLISSRHHSQDNNTQLISWQEQAMIDRLCGDITLNKVIHI
uniref:Amino acid transporter n=1 Tax=Meloidogyne incognita TaxID=6306 RepID=A0A914NNS3_MELIC